MGLLSNWRTYVVLLILSLGGWGGWSANTLLRPTPAPLPPVTNTVTVERVVTRTVTVVKNPDGTETSTTTETTADTSTNTSKPTSVASVKPRWSAEAIAAVKPKGWELPKPTWSTILYHRVGDTNLWAGGGYDFGNKAALLAVRVDF